MTRPTEFVDHLMRELPALFRDGDQRRCMVEDAERWVVQKFSQEHWFQRFEDAYDTMLVGT